MCTEHPYPGFLPLVELLPQHDGAAHLVELLSSEILFITIGVMHLGAQSLASDAPWIGTTGVVLPELGSNNIMYRTDDNDDDGCALVYHHNVFAQP